MKKTFILIAAILGFTFSAVFLQAQHLFSVSQNDLSTESVTLLRNQIAGSEISTLSLTKNNEDKEVYAIAFSSNTKIVILNEQNGNNVVIVPAGESPAEFQLAPFFIEELRQGILGNADHYFILETTNDFSVKNVAAVSATKREVFIPRYLYGPKEDVKEAFPQDRQIIHIFKEKPRLILVDPNDLEMQRYAAQWEEAMSYYVYMYQLPDGGLWIYDEHFNIDDEEDVNKIGGNGYLEFTLTGNMNAEQRAAMEYALELWSEQLAGTVPVGISLTFSPPSGISYRSPSYWDPETETWYCSAVGNQMAGYNVVPNMRNIRMEMSSYYVFYYGLDANPGSGIDFVTVMLHDVAHGLGFSSLCGANGRYSYGTPTGGSANTDYPGIFDRQLFDGLTGVCITELTQSERAAVVKSGNLYAGAPGSNLLAANEGTRIKMYAPSNFQSHSSASHWNPSVYNFQTFMKPTYQGGALHTFNTRKIGMLQDCGWTLPDNPDAIYVTFDANGGNKEMPSQEFLSGVEKKLRANAFTRTNYTFIGWNTAPDGTGTSYTDRQAITISNNMELYAQWQGDTYALTFDPDEGTVDPTSKPVVYGSPIGELPIPVKEGYVFDSWRIGTVHITGNSIFTWLQDVTATARWSGLGIVETRLIASLQIVPNPASDFIELQISPAGGGQRGWNNYALNQVQGQIDLIEFYNIFGQLVKSVPFAGKTNKDITTQKINIADLSAGVYVVKAGNNVVKLIIK